MAGAARATAGGYPVKTLFITSGTIEWGSARMRAYWPAQYMEDTGVVPVKEIIKDGQIPKADAYIWQKYIVDDIAAQLRELGAFQVWDVCDPLHWFSPQSVLNQAPLMNKIVCSTSGLANDLRNWLHDSFMVDAPPITVIPDRLEPSHFIKRREHARADPVRFVWFGISINRGALFGAAANLERLADNGHNIALSIMDERPDKQYHDIEGSFPVFYTKWRLDKEVEVIAGHDIALLPPYPGPWGEVKSNNKRLTAWACGLPVVDGFDYTEMERLVVSHSARRVYAESHEDVFADYHVKDSAIEYEMLLDERVPV